MGGSRSQAVLGPPTQAAIFLVATVDEGGEAAVRELLAEVGGTRRAVGFRAIEGDLRCVVGIGSDLWTRIAGAPRPAGLHPFAEVAGARHTAIATPGDLLFHLRAGRLDLCFELAALLAERLPAAGGSWTRCTGSARSTSAICSASSTAPRTRRAPTRPKPRWSGPAIRTSPAAAT